MYNPYQREFDSPLLCVLFYCGFALVLTIRKLLVSMAVLQNILPSLARHRAWVGFPRIIHI